MNRYEAMFIFPESVKDTNLEEVLGRVRAEIKKLGGEVESTTRLGKRAFAREMQKQQAGHYVIITMLMPGEQVAPLLARYKLSEDVFRVQVVRVPEAAAAAAASGEEQDNGVA